VPTLQEYRRQFAKDMGAFGPTPTGGVATDGTASTLVQETWPVLSRIAKDNLYEGWFLLRQEAGDVGDTVRQIPSGGYHPDLGTLDVDADYTTPPAADEVYELHGHDFEPWHELRDVLNEALKLIYIPVQVPFRPASWLSSGDNLQQVLNFTQGDGSGAAHRQISQLLHSGLVTRLDFQEPSAIGILSMATTGGSAGSYTFSYGSYTSGSILYSANGAAVQTALRLIPGLEAVEIASSGVSGNFSFIISLYGVPLGSPALTVNQGTFNGSIASALSPGFGKLDPLSARLFMNGSDVMAELYRSIDASSNHVYVTFLVRAYDWCRTGTTVAWGGQAGLSLDTDLGLPIAEHVSVAAQLIGWKRSPRVMEEATEHRRALSQADAQQEFDAYQAAYLKSATRSPLLTYDVDGEMLDLKLPFSLGGAIPGPAARALVSAPGFNTPPPTV
jgi:hypothetical protein